VLSFINIPSGSLSQASAK